MARKSSEDVFDLVKSLNPSEKRYFRLFTSLHVVGESNKYMQLFELIEEMSEMDDEYLKQKVDPSGGVSFSKLKRYLYQLILKSLRNYYADKNTSNTLVTMMHDLSILYQKGLRDQCFKLAERAARLADESQMHSYQLLVSNWRKKLINRFGAPTGMQDNSTDAQAWKRFKGLEEALEAYRQASEMADLEFYTNNLEEYPLVKSIAANSIPKSSASTKERFYRHRVKAIASKLNGQHNEHLKHAKEAIDVASSLPGLAEEDEHIFYVSPLIELIEAELHNSNDGTGAIPHLKKLRAYIASKGFTRQDINLASSEAFLYLAEAQTLMAEGNGKLTDKIQRLTEFCGQYQNEIRPFIAYKAQFLRAKYLINQGRCAEAKELLESLSTSKSSVVPLAVKSIARMILVVARFECGDFSTLMTMRTSRRLSSQTEGLVLKYIQQMLPKQIDNAAHWLRLKNEISESLSRGSERMISDWIDLKDWINHKIQEPFKRMPIRSVLL